jgi:hypothetical protein
LSKDLLVYELTDRLVRRFAAVSDITPEEHIEDEQEEFLAGLEARKMKGIVDEEERTSTTILNWICRRMRTMILSEALSFHTWGIYQERALPSIIIISGSTSALQRSGG